MGEKTDCMTLMFSVMLRCCHSGCGDLAMTTTPSNDDDDDKIY